MFSGLRPWPLAVPDPASPAGRRRAACRERDRCKSDAVMCHLGFEYVHRRCRGPEQSGRQSRLHTGPTSATSPATDATPSPRYQQGPQPLPLTSGFSGRGVRFTGVRSRSGSVLTAVVIWNAVAPEIEQSSWQDGAVETGPSTWSLAGCPASRADHAFAHPARVGGGGDAARAGADRPEAEADRR